MSIDELLAQLRYRRLILISDSELWPSPHVTQAIRRALRRHRQGLKVLIEWSSIDTCPSRDLHRQHWKYAGGGGHYICEVCSKIAC